MTYLACCAVLVGGALVARGWPWTPLVADGDDDWYGGAPLDPRTVAYLRGGRYAVVLTVLAELHAWGAVDASRRVRPVAPLPRVGFDDPLVRAVYAGATWCTEPRLIAALPAVRRATRSLRSDLVERGLLPPVRRRLLVWALLGYAAGLAVAGVFESGRQPSTVVGALAVLAAVALATTGPRRTVAGQRVLWAERRLLADLVDSTPTHPSLLTAMVALDGRGALDLLCARFIPVGALAPAPVGVPARAPRPRPVLVPVPAVVPVAREGRPVGLAAIPAPRPVPISIRIPAARRPVYEPASDGPAIIVRPAFADPIAA